jgi:hypothetical protein
MTRNELDQMTADLATITRKPLHLERFMGVYRIQETTSDTGGQRHYTPNMTGKEMAMVLTVALTVAKDVTP